MIDKNLTYAVIWASNNTEKYGYKVFKDLIEKWFNAIAINPKEDEILWKKTYSTLSDFDGKIDVLIFVLDPKIAFEILKNEVKNLWIQKVWFQPWAESEESISWCQENQIDYIANACIMINS